jgi:anaphase-promoting complex subunit 2
MEQDDADGSLDSWARFCSLSNELLGGDGDLSVGPRLVPVVADLCARGLATLVRDYFLHSIEVETIHTPPLIPSRFLSPPQARTHTTAAGLLFPCSSGDLGGDRCAV